ncbi:YciI family protein [Nitrosospira lacus]|uniref:YCII-related domain-containing protein n=1 Tax=Nitrosospira lacus TaxID=1288494 RepID=A0A1W6SMU1_9PROT|nr:YciI family protein [Nitrosospira lacus]ARO87095.1 YciI family protein [Nitrosospira lacus]
MKYLCLICAETVMEQRAEADAERHYEEYSEFTEAIRKSGHFLGCNRLLPPDAAITVRVRKGKVTTTDGPFVETKEQLGGYYVLEAKDLNEAIQIASRIPGARIGCVEVRPIAEDERTLRALGFADTVTPQLPWSLPE